MEVRVLSIEVEVLFRGVIVQVGREGDYKMSMLASFIRLSVLF